MRGEAATLPFFSNGQYHNPMVLRIAGYGYQKGFGGHFHNDDAVAVLRDIPGIVVASPARPDDAAAMLRTCLAAASATGRRAFSWSRSRYTTPVTCTTRTTVTGSRRIPHPANGMPRLTLRSARREYTATVAT